MTQDLGRLIAEYGLLLVFANVLVDQLGFPVPAAPVYALTDGVTVSAANGAPLAGNAFALGGAVGIDAVQFTLTDVSLSESNAVITVTSNGQASNPVMLPVQ